MQVVSQLRIGRLQAYIPEPYRLKRRPKASTLKASRPGERLEGCQLGDWLGIRGVNKVLNPVR